MTFNDTHPEDPGARGPRSKTNLIYIGDALRRRRILTGDSPPDGAEAPRAIQLAPGIAIGYFLHANRCIQVEYGASESLWVHERPYTADMGPLADFYAFNRLEYTELGHITWPMRTLHFTYLGGKTEPAWMPIPSPSLADLLRKVLSLYDCVTKGAQVHAADGLKPNPAPPQYDPNRKAR